MTDVAVTIELLIRGGMQALDESGNLHRYGSVEGISADRDALQRSADAAAVAVAGRRRRPRRRGGLRLQGRGGAFATNWHALVAAFGALSVFWVAIWVLDFAYYNRLLLGAVNALVTIEKASAAGETTLDRLNLSHDIEDAVASKPSVKGRNSKGRWIFYILVFSVLMTGLSVSIYKVRSAPPAAQTAPHTAPTANPRTPPAVPVTPTQSAPATPQPTPP